MRTAALRASAALCFSADGRIGKRTQGARGRHDEGTDDGGEGVLRGLLFHRNMLCALELDAACATFRPDHPDGLRPPQQLRFVFRQERRARTTWAFPTAEEQAALHAA